MMIVLFFLKEKDQKKQKPYAGLSRQALVRRRRAMALTSSAETPRPSYVASSAVDIPPYIPREFSQKIFAAAECAAWGFR